MPKVPKEKTDSASYHGTPHKACERLPRACPTHDREYGPLRHLCGGRIKSVGDNRYVLDLAAAVYYIIVIIIIVVVNRLRVCMGGFCYVDY